MSRREGNGSSHIPKNVHDDNPRDNRRPSVPLIQYPGQHRRPSAPPPRPDPPPYSPYDPPPPTRPSYPPEHSRADTRLMTHGQPPMDMSRAPERLIVYPRQSDYYTPETGIPPAHQPAPRQRTAVACRYCRRRKIRCSGYQSSPDGRCTNCVQRDQKCEFLPVSAAPYEAPRPEPSYLTPPHSTQATSMGGHRTTQHYGIPPAPPPSYHLSPYTSPQQRRRSLGRTDFDLMSPPRKKQAIDPSSSGRPSLAPLQTGPGLRRRPTSHELRSGYQDTRSGSSQTDYSQHSPSYTAGTSPQHRRGSLYSSTPTAPLHPPQAMPPSRSPSEMSPYTLLPPPPPRSPPRQSPGHARRYSYQPQAPYSPERPYSARPTSQGRPHLPSPMSAVHSLPPPPLAYSRSSPTLRYASGPPRPPPDYADRPTISPQYEYGESTSLPPLAHLNRESPPLLTVAPAMPSPIAVALPPPSGMITAPRNPGDSAILSAFDSITESPSSRPPPIRTPTP